VKFRRSHARVDPEGQSEAVIFVNHSGNRTWYMPDLYMGEYPGSYSSAVDVSSVELYWMCLATRLYSSSCTPSCRASTRERGAAVWIQPASTASRRLGRPSRSAPWPRRHRWGVYPEFGGIHGSRRVQDHPLRKPEGPRQVDESRARRCPTSVSSRRSRRGRSTLRARCQCTSRTRWAPFRSLFEKHWL